MTRLLSLLSVFLVSAAFAAAQAVPKDPPALTTLKTRYEADLQAKREPIRSRYIAALELLKREHSKANDLEAAIAVERELSNILGKAGPTEAGKITSDLTTLKTRYHADAQAAIEPLQIRYISALETLQQSFTKQNDLPSALAVRRELTNIKPQASRTPTIVPADIPQTPRGHDDIIQANTVWLSDTPNKNGVTSSFTIIERQGETFRGKYEFPNTHREFTGTVKDGKIWWYGKDVRAIKGNPGGDNIGTINGDKIDFVWRNTDGQTGTFLMRKKQSKGN